EDDVGARVAPALAAQALHGFGAETEAALDDVVDGARGGEDDPDAPVEQHPEVGEVNLARGLAEGEQHGVVLDAERKGLEVEDDLERDRIEFLAGELALGEVHELETLRDGEGSPCLLLGSEAEVHERAVLGRAEAALPVAGQIELAFGDASGGQEDVAG